ncbi:uncharacterized protein VTP21DRAFT_11140 [Calcarisporiella thermophila]|uniref:uncharacterized protein n=1 Tax=Calcarisporiella thermophila TaxID=911321 RepID=UPI003743E587
MFGRLISYWANQFITERLLQSPTFHRMAAKTHEKVSKLQNQSQPLIQEGSHRVNTFVQAFKENLKKESEKLGRR